MSTYREKYHKLGSLISAADNMAALLKIQISDVLSLIPEKEGERMMKNIGTLAATLRGIDQKVLEIKSLSYRFVPPDKSLRDVETELKKENAAFKVLVVDDLEAICEAQKQFLERHGFTVYVATDVATAKESIQKNPPDIVILDLSLPDKMEGLDVLEFLKQNQPAARCIIVTREDSEEGLARARAAQPDKILIKPIEIELLVAQINALIKKA
jgi:CheY-like chemotaxis protein